MNPKVSRTVKLGLWLVAISGGALALHGSSAATGVLHPVPRPSPPGTDEMATGAFQCQEVSDSSTGFSFLSFGGTTGINSPSIGGRFPLDSGTSPLTCQGLAQQVAADAAAGGCTVGPISVVPSDFDEPETTVHFVCSGGHDAVVDAIGQVAASFAAVTISSPID